MNPELTLLLKHISGAAPSETLHSAYKKYSDLNNLVQPSHKGFSNFLAVTALKNSFFLKIIDVWTRLFDRDNLIRHKLNAVVAFGELNPAIINKWKSSYQTIGAAWVRLISELFIYILTLAFTFPVVGCLFLTFLIKQMIPSSLQANHK